MQRLGLCEFDDLAGGEDELGDTVPLPDNAYPFLWGDRNRTILRDLDSHRPTPRPLTIQHLHYTCTGRLSQPIEPQSASVNITQSWQDPVAIRRTTCILRYLGGQYMRRSDRAITCRKAIDDFIRSCRVCRLGLCRDNQPYIVPLCFGYDGEALYFHCAPEGEKLDVLHSNNQVCFEFDAPGEVVVRGAGCQCSMRYRSVIGFGTAEFVEDIQAKRQALSLLLAQYREETHHELHDPDLKRTCVIRVNIERVTGKEHQ